jgi:hypothetical protein
MSCALACQLTGYTQILNGFLEICAALIVMGQLIDVIIEAIGIERLDCGAGAFV